MIGALYCRKWLKDNDYVDIQCCHITFNCVFSVSTTATVNYTRHKPVKLYEGTFHLKAHQAIVWMNKEARISTPVRT
jgi:hypothetical protein